MAIELAAMYVGVLGFVGYVMCTLVERIDMIGEKRL